MAIYGLLAVPSLSLRQRRGLRYLLLVALAALLLAEVSHRVGALQRIDDTYTDLWYRLAGQRDAPRHTALVLIDNASLARFPDDPLVFWSPQIAAALTTLREVGARTIALDILFGISPERWLRKMSIADPEPARDFDRGFRQEVSKGTTILAGMSVGRDTRSGHDVLELPLPEVLLAIPDLDVQGYVGLANLARDDDGVVRHFRAQPDLDPAPDQRGVRPYLSLAALAAIHASGKSSHAASWQLGQRTVSAADPAARIRFIGPPGTYRPLSIARLLAPGAFADPEVQALKGKVVVLGGGFSGMQDFHFTPYSVGLFDAGNLMMGPELQANIIETLMSGQRDVALQDSTRLLWFIAFLLPACLLFWRYWGWPMFAAGAGSLLLPPVGAWLLFADGTIAPVASLQLALFVAWLGALALRLRLERREREFARSAFARYLSPQIVETMLQRDELPMLGGTRAVATVLFADIRDFTTLSEQLTPEEVVELLNYYFDRAVVPLMAEGGTIDKFIGDAIMAEFGIPVSHPDHARRALRAAMGLGKAADDVAAWAAKRFPHMAPFRIGIGIHSGPVVAGNIGSQHKLDYTVIGDTVNTASRLESHTKAMGVRCVMSRATLDQAGAGVLTGAREVVQVKGREASIEIIELLGIEG
ncbi:adenylate/guanylate cyclase domain-containing protein [Chitinimonas sp. BJYL2]|uniref:adenylate/guanylate cyclase domain-containing protein n=1 Tax=Chitinimonas sp. BJYL2 TaxID=2976696 RepID=UPI0022B55D2A|nr:adenylate/guanylate cyclase domain-containing protein [Chitinimonas sp. BJYL2]